MRNVVEPVEAKQSFTSLQRLIHEESFCFLNKWNQFAITLKRGDAEIFRTHYIDVREVAQSSLKQQAAYPTN